MTRGAVKRRRREMTSREWLSLGVLAANAASSAHSEAVARYYNELAKKCDELAEIADTQPIIRLVK